MVFKNITFLSVVVACSLAVHTESVYTVAEHLELRLSTPIATTIPKAVFVAPLTGRAARGNLSKTYRREVIKYLTGSKYSGELAGADFDETYVTPITVGGQKVSLS
jgi:hypothetical protein